MTDGFLHECLPILTRTPKILDCLLRGLPEPWIAATEGPGTWSPYVVVGHLIHAERTDWIPRLNMILQFGTDRPFDRFDREAQFRESQGKSLGMLLNEFEACRETSLAQLKDLDLKPAQFDLKGEHPTLGEVTVRQLLATWTAHDLAHLVQINRVMARRLKPEVGPFSQFLSVMQ
jgi:hypothetical protein